MFVQQLKIFPSLLINYHSTKHESCYTRVVVVHVYRQGGLQFILEHPKTIG